MAVRALQKKAVTFEVDQLEPSHLFHFIPYVMHVKVTYIVDLLIVLIGDCFLVFDMLSL